MLKSQLQVAERLEPSKRGQVLKILECYFLESRIGEDRFEGFPLVHPIGYRDGIFFFAAPLKPLEEMMPSE